MPDLSTVKLVWILHTILRSTPVLCNRLLGNTWSANNIDIEINVHNKYCKDILVDLCHVLLDKLTEVSIMHPMTAKDFLRSAEQGASRASFAYAQAVNFAIPKENFLGQGGL
jgi:hypothetical protein